MRNRARKIGELAKSSTNAAISILKSHGVVISDREKDELFEAVTAIVREYLEDTLD